MIDVIKWVFGIIILVVAGLDIYMSCYSDGYGDGAVDAMNIMSDILKNHNIIEIHEIMNKATNEINKKITTNWRIK